jgi:hypothetical protein
MEKPRHAPVSASPVPLLSTTDLRIGFGGAGLMILAYPLVRLIGGSEIFNLPLLCVLFVVLAGGFVFFSLPRAGAAREPRLAPTSAENPSS